MKYISHILSIPFTIGLVLFTLSNRNAIELFFWPLPGSLDIPLYLLGIGMLVCGFLIGLLTSWVTNGHRRKRSNALKRNARSLEVQLKMARTELEQLRSEQPINRTASV